MPKKTKEQVFDTEILPLLKEVQEIMNRAQINAFFQFSFGISDRDPTMASFFIGGATPDEDDPGYWTIRKLLVEADQDQSPVDYHPSKKKDVGPN